MVGDWYYDECQVSLDLDLRRGRPAREHGGHGGRRETDRRLRGPRRLRGLVRGHGARGPGRADRGPRRRLHRRLARGRRGPAPSEPVGAYAPPARHGPGPPDAPRPCQRRRPPRQPLPGRRRRRPGPSWCSSTASASSTTPAWRLRSASRSPPAPTSCSTRCGATAGRSSSPSGYRVADHVADLVGAARRRRPRPPPVHLVGCSYGGAVATVTAIRHPERVASVVYADGVLPVPGWTRRRIMPWLEQGMASSPATTPRTTSPPSSRRPPAQGSTAGPPGPQDCCSTPRCSMTSATSRRSIRPTTRASAARCPPSTAAAPRCCTWPTS